MKHEIATNTNIGHQCAVKFIKRPFPQPVLKSSSESNIEFSDEILSYVLIHLQNATSKKVNSCDRFQISMNFRILNENYLIIKCE